MATISPQQALEGTIIRLFRHQSTPSLQPALHQAIRLDQRTLFTSNYHQVLIPALNIEVPALYQSAVHEEFLMFHVNGSADLIGGQLMILSRVWLSDTAITVFLPNDPDLIRGIRIILHPPTLIDFTNITYIHGGHDGVAELSAQVHQTSTRASEPRVLEYYVAPTPRVSIYQPRNFVYPVPARAPAVGSERPRSSALDGTISAGRASVPGDPAEVARPNTGNGRRSSNNITNQEIIIASVRGADTATREPRSSRANDSSSRGSDGKSKKTGRKVGRPRKNATRSTATTSTAAGGNNSAATTSTAASASSSAATASATANTSSSAATNSEQVGSRNDNEPEQSGSSRNRNERPLTRSESVITSTGTRATGTVLVTTDTEPIVIIKTEPEDDNASARRITCRRKCLCHKH